MSTKKEVVEADVEYKPRKLGKQGGSTITTLPNKLVEEAAEEMSITVSELRKNFELTIEVFRDPKGSLLNGEIILSIVEKGGGIKE